MSITHYKEIEKKNKKIKSKQQVVTWETRKKEVESGASFEVESEDKTQVAGKEVLGWRGFLYTTRPLALCDVTVTTPHKLPIAGFMCILWDLYPI